MSFSRMINPFIRACNDRVLLKNMAINSSMMNLSKRIETSGITIRTFAAPKKAIEEVVVVKNKQIRYPKVRVVYNDSDGKSKHEIMTRDAAIKFAADLKLDLVLVNANADPPICRVENSVQLLTKKKDKAKEIRVAAKARALKEMFIGGGIDVHDLGIKMKKVIEFLDDGHPVRIFVTAKKLRLLKDPFCVEETTLKVLDAVEPYVQSVQQPESSTPSRKDFTLNPKAKQEPVAKSDDDKKDKKNKDKNEKNSDDKEKKKKPKDHEPKQKNDVNSQVFPPLPGDEIQNTAL